MRQHQKQFLEKQASNSFLLLQTPKLTTIVRMMRLLKELHKRPLTILSANKRSYRYNCWHRGFC
jgi:hypothetical protein